jgi:hypothetical protein
MVLAVVGVDGSGIGRTSFAFEMEWSDMYAHEDTQEATL